MNIERFALLRKNSFKEDLEYFSNIYRLGCKAFEAIPDCEIEKCIESKTIGNIWIERSCENEVVVSIENLAHEDVENFCFTVKMSDFPEYVWISIDVVKNEVTFYGDLEENEWNTGRLRYSAIKLMFGEFLVDYECNEHFTVSTKAFG